ncbi:Late embryogenesis abundant protein, LEA-14 [Corchorus capsularis]|uniref:Late embryogenesis abundant protein, LEA-14 n=1 Tax=Corchorus capsularis TaxID=210143 RepID=A0A1R3IBE2_COCAP|nr:Late embryogenesis abundant protein, LEA-14 [Corchorus capsularis]
MPPTNMNPNHHPHARETRPTANGDHHQHHHGLTAPPQRHHAYYPRSSSSASFKGCCCCLFLLFSFLALLVLAVVLIIVLAVKPKKPQFDLQQVGVQYMGISTSNPSAFDGTATAVTTNPTTASLSLTIHMLFTAANPNKVGIKYDESRFTVMYRGIPLGKATVPGFYQEAHSTRNVEATIAVDRANLMQADAADLIRDASLNDRVELRVLGDVGAKIRVLEFDSPGVQVTPFSSS